MLNALKSHRVALLAITATALIHAQTTAYNEISHKLSTLQISAEKQVADLNIYEVDKLITNYVRESDQSDFRLPSSERITRIKSVNTLYSEELIILILNYAEKIKIVRVPPLIFYASHPLRNY
jgi:hypothetical protein